MNELDHIKYKFIIDLTRFFIGKYNNGIISDLDLVVNNVKSQVNFIKEMSFVFDETIWFPNHPETYKNLIQFNVKLHNTSHYLPFRLLINKGMNQEPILLNQNHLFPLIIGDVCL